MILLTGSSGLLGQELQKHVECDAPSREEFDIMSPWSDWYRKWHWDNYMKQVEKPLIVHCAAFTDLVSAEKERELCYQTNIIGTRNLASLGIPMIYISTEYVFDGEKGNYVEEDYCNPVNFYGLTKLLGEYESRRTRSVVIRCLFKPRPFKHENACIDQFTSGSYVDQIAPEIALAIRNFDRLPATIHIGFERKSTFDLARNSREVRAISLEDIKGVKLPKDTSLNCEKWNKLKESWKNAD